MKTLFVENEKEKQMNTEKEVSYEHAGYHIYVHFTGNKTLTQCIKDLADRKMDC